MEHLNTYKVIPAEKEDLARLYNVAKLMHVTHEKGYFEKCLEEKSAGKREILLAEIEGEVVGYIQLIWSPVYQLFKKLGIPEIQDLNVEPSARSQGIGAALVDACEELVIARGCAEIGIGFGVDSSFGAAQRLYIKRGYIPDGNGVCYDEEPIPSNAMRSVDKLLTLKLIKELSV